MQPPLSTELREFNECFTRIEPPERIRRVTNQQCFNPHPLFNSFFISFGKIRNKLVGTGRERDRDGN
jgi:hypothetical protein